MPVRWLNAFIEMMPAIEAQESLNQIKVLGVGTGSYKKGDARSTINEWRRAESRMTERQATKMPKDVRGKKEMLKAMGIAVEVNKKNG